MRALLPLILLIACGQPEALVKTAAPEGANNETIVSAAENEKNLLAHFKFENSVDANAKLAIQNDLKTLAAWADTARPEALAKLGSVTGLKVVNSKTLSNWLMERLTYIYPVTGGKFEVGLIRSSSKKVVPLAFQGPPKEGIVAANIGPGVFDAYSINKGRGFDGVLIKFDSQYLPFLSLRTGVVLVGASTFAAAATDTASDPDSVSLRRANTIFRLNALFHEARHSDGNAGAGTLGLLHVACPQNGPSPVEYAGSLACDRFANGPYAVGALVMDALMGLCDGKCTEAIKAELQAARIDYTSRIVVTNDKAHYGDANPEMPLSKIDTTTFQIMAP